MKQSEHTMTQSESNINIIKEWLRLLNQTTFYDDTLTELIKKFPNHNEDSEASIGIKVATIDSLMKTKVSGKNNQIELVTNHIRRLYNIDTWIKEGDSSAVSELARECSTVGRHNHYSFATKYCYWHSRCLEGEGNEKFIIYDRNVITALQILNAHPDTQFTSLTLKGKKIRQYENYKKAFNEFKNAYGLNLNIIDRKIELGLWKIYDAKFKPFRSRNRAAGETKEQYELEKALSNQEYLSELNRLKKFSH